MSTLAAAINYLRPNTEWSLNGDDVANIIWHTENVKPITDKELTTAIAKIEKAEAEKKAADAAARAAAIEHAKSLGFTDAMIAVMYPNLAAAGDVTE